jgi:hypothetical protein
MNGSQGQQMACRARRWSRTAGRQLTLAGSLVACLLLVSAVPVAASARPAPGGIDDPFGRATGIWSDWSVQPPDGQPDSSLRFDQRPPEILASVDPMVGPYSAGSEVRVDFTCTDSGSGIRWCPVQATLDTTFPGYHSVSFYAVDVAGNVASTVIEYIVVAGWSSPMVAFPTPGGEWV